VRSARDHSAVATAAPISTRALTACETTPPAGLQQLSYARAGSSPPRSVPAISSSGAFSFGMKPDFIPK
jgi:hypothetical protein